MTVLNDQENSPTKWNPEKGNSKITRPKKAFFFFFIEFTFNLVQVMRYKILYAASTDGVYEAFKTAQSKCQPCFSPSIHSGYFTLGGAAFLEKIY